MVEEQDAVEGLVLAQQRLVNRDGSAECAGIAVGVYGWVVEHVVHIVRKELHRNTVGDAGTWEGGLRHPVLNQIALIASSPF